jgi:hypothetical protein
MRALFSCLCVIVLVVGIASIASADCTCIGFENFDVGTIVSGPGVFSDVVFSSGGAAITVASDIPGPEFSGNRSAIADYAGEYRNPIRADFLIGGIESVSVVIGDYDADADSLYLNAYDGGGNLLDQDTYELAADVYGGPTLQVSGDGIAYVIFGNTGVFPNSVFFDNFCYESETVPEPSSLLALSLLGSGPVGGLIRRKK